MTIGKAAALTAAFVAAVAVGVAIGPFVTRPGDRSAVSPAAGDLSRPAAETPQPAITEEAPPAKIVRPARPKAATANAEKSASRNLPRVSLSAPALAERLKPVLNRGANITVAADGFHDAEQFAAVAHAARNTKVPFMVLKHRVLDEKQSLADALGAAKPTLDAAAEARRARTEAQSDVKAVVSTFAN